MRSLRVLVVEDDDGIREALGLALEDAGHAFLGAANGRRALELLERERPDVIVLDVRMGIMDGVEFSRRYRKRGGDAPIVVLTALGGAARAGEIGATRFVEKPFDLDTLLAAVEQAAADAPDDGRA